MTPYRLIEEDRQRFERDGYFVVPDLLSEEETALVEEITTMILPSDPHRLDRHDAAGNSTLLSLRNALSDDVYSSTVQSERIAGTMAALLADEVYHYHHKVMIKEPEVGGAWEWHQDYGYWYDNGCLWPDMASCMIAISGATRENGCLQVVPGSHRMGRVDHVLVGDQVCAAPERVAQILERVDVVQMELPAGAGLFFHANLLHSSNRNTSPSPRLSLINCYNTRNNDPYKEHHHPGYSPMKILPDASVLEAGRKQRDALRSRSDG